MKNNSLWKEILQLDLSDVLSNVQVPYIILQGDTDFVASTKTVEEVVDASKNNNLKVHIVENTGHMPVIMMVDLLVEIFESLV